MSFLHISHTIPRYQEFLHPLGRRKLFNTPKLAQLIGNTRLTNIDQYLVQIDPTGALFFCQPRVTLVPYWYTNTSSGVQAECCCLLVFGNHRVWHINSQGVEQESRATLACLYRTLGQVYHPPSIKGALFELHMAPKVTFLKYQYHVRMWACSNTSSYQKVSWADVD